MNVIDTEKQRWFLFEHENRLYLDANCNHSFVGYSYMIELNESELLCYKSEGKEYLNRLSYDIHYPAPIVKDSESAFKGRDVSQQFSLLVDESIKRWKSEK